MTTGHTVLVLGAGASWSLGYPLGSELTRDIIDLGGSYAHLLDKAGLRPRQIEMERFLREFQSSNLFSIDAFLARRPEFEKIGKLAIATILISREDPRSLYLSHEKDPWYRYFLNTVTHDSWDRLDFSNLRIVTFNYDRSLEHFLLRSLMASYGKSVDEVRQKLHTLSIVHCYGTLGAVWPGDKDFHSYDRTLSVDRVEQAANLLKVLPEGRDDSQEFNLARNHLRTAGAIIFLGFGFDPMNLKRLDSTRTCAAVIEREGESSLTRTVAATCYNLKQFEIEIAREATAGKTGGWQAVQDKGQINGFDRFCNMGCTDLLRETQLLQLAITRWD